MLEPVTSTLRLRHFVPEDVSAVFALSQEPSFARWLPTQVYADEAEAERVVQSLIDAYASPGDPRLGPYVLAVEREDGALIGHVGFSPIGTWKASGNRRRRSRLPAEEFLKRYVVRSWLPGDEGYEEQLAAVRKQQAEWEARQNVEVEIGFAIGEKDQGRGFGAEAVEAACRWAFETFDFERIVGITAEANVASQRTLLRAGFCCEGTDTMPFMGRAQRVVLFMKYGVAG